MLRTRRRDNNVKPNRRLDRRSSRGMIFENEELRLKTININAEVERGHSDIKKLKRENDQLRREIWYLRDEYDKLDKLLRRKGDSGTSTCSSDSETCSSCSDETEAVETSQNLENVQKTNLNRLNHEFDHLSVVTEENSIENSEKTSLQDVIQPDQSYPPFAAHNGHFFAPIPANDAAPLFTYEQPAYLVPPLSKSHSDLMVKMDNVDFSNGRHNGFCNGGNLDDLLKDIENISHDILQISNEPHLPRHELDGAPVVAAAHPPKTSDAVVAPELFKSELNVALMPTPMTLIGTDKYRQLGKSCENMRRSRESVGGSYLSLPNKCESNSANYVMCGTSAHEQQMEPAAHSNPFFFGQLPPSSVDNGELYNARYNPDNFNAPNGDEAQLHEPPPEADNDSKTNLIEVATSSENEEHLRFNTSKEETSKSPKLDVRRKVSIHFKGKKEKPKEDEAAPTTSESKTTTSENTAKTSSSSEGKARRKSTSISPERGKPGHKTKDKCHRKHRNKEKKRIINPFAVDRCHRERSFSVCTDRSNILDHRLYGTYDETNSERTNSVSSCDTNKGRTFKVNAGEKIPWCGCWGNGCL